MICIDTNVFLKVLYNEAGSKRAEDLLHKAKQSGIVISTITIAEILASVYKRSPEIAVAGKALVENFVGVENIVPVNIEVAELAGKLKAKYASKRATFSLADAVILATAIISGCESLVTFDPEFKPIEELHIID